MVTPIRTAFRVSSRSSAAVFQRPGQVVLCLDPGQANKVKFVVEGACASPALPLGHLVFVALEQSPDEIHAAADECLARLDHDPSRDFGVSVIDAREAIGVHGQCDTAALVAGLGEMALEHRPFGGIFGPLDRYVQLTAQVAKALAAKGALPADRVSLDPDVLQRIMNKGTFRQIMGMIDPTGDRLLHPQWAVMPLETLTVESLRRQFGTTGELFLLPLRGASKRAVQRVDLADPHLQTALAEERAAIAWWHGRPRSGVEDAHQVLAVQRVRGREYSIEVVKGVDFLRVVQVHWKGDQGDVSDPDGTFERIYVAQGTSVGGVITAPDVQRLEEDSAWMFRQLAKCGCDPGNGVFHLEARIDHATGKTYFIELNPRPGGSAVPDLVRVASGDAVHLYGLQLAVALGVPPDVPLHRYHPVADLTLFADGIRMGPRAHEFSGFVFVDPDNGSERPLNGVDDDQVSTMLQAALQGIRRAHADQALQRAIALGYETPDGEALLTAFRRQAAWQGVQVKGLRFEPWLLPGAVFHGAAYLGNVLAQGDDQLEPIAAQAHLVSAMALVRGMLIGRATTGDSSSSSLQAVPSVRSAG